MAFFFFQNKKTYKKCVLLDFEAQKFLNESCKNNEFCRFLLQYKKNEYCRFPLQYKKKKTVENEFSVLQMTRLKMFFLNIYMYRKMVGKVVSATRPPEKD